jgi:hypothetical protein
MYLPFKPGPSPSLPSLPFLLSLLSLLFISCGDDNDDNPNPVPIQYLVCDYKLNNQNVYQYVSDEFRFNLGGTSASLGFEGHRTVDTSFIRFGFFVNNPLSLSGGDSLVIPYDSASNIYTYATVLIKSAFPSMFLLDSAGTPGMIYIDDIDIANRYVKGRFRGTFYVGTDSLKLFNGRFLIDE